MSRLAELMSGDAYARHLGLRLIDDPDDVVVEMVVRPEHLNFMGSTHGGAVFSLADCALSLISNADQRAVAIDTHLVITGATGPGDTLTARAHEESKGKKLASYRITINRGDGRVVGLFTGTVMIISD